jgi:hypothetical protein
MTFISPDVMVKIIMIPSTQRVTIILQRLDSQSFICENTVHHMCAKLVLRQYWLEHIPYTSSINVFAIGLTQWTWLFNFEHSSQYYCTSSSLAVFERSSVRNTFCYFSNFFGLFESIFGQLDSDLTLLSRVLYTCT